MLKFYIVLVEFEGKRGAKKGEGEGGQKGGSGQVLSKCLSNSMTLTASVEIFWLYLYKKIIFTVLLNVAKDYDFLNVLPSLQINNNYYFGYQRVVKVLLLEPQPRASAFLRE